MAPLEPQEKGLDWQSRARMTFVPPEWKCLRGGIASLAANGSARRFASAPIIRCCAAVGGSAALRMRHTPCGCRSADLVGVLTNIRLPEHSTMRRAPAMPHSAGSLPPNYRHTRLTIVRRGCKTHTSGGEAMYTAPDYPQGVCHIRKAAELPTAVQCAARAALRAPIRQCRGSRGSPLAFLWGFQRGYSLWKENTPFAPRPHGSGTEHRALWASKKRIQLSLYE